MMKRKSFVSMINKLFTNVLDGWIRGPHDQLLLWVPVDKRVPFYNPGTGLVMPRGGIELDLSQMAHGSKWQACFQK